MQNNVEWIVGTEVMHLQFSGSDKKIWAYDVHKKLKALGIWIWCAQSSTRIFEIPKSETEE